MEARMRISQMLLQNKKVINRTLQFFSTWNLDQTLPIKC